MNRSFLPPSLREGNSSARAAWIVAALALTLSLLTMNSTFGFVDKGELAAAAVTLGIPHPTGYPTVMLLGRLITTLLPVRDVYALNILAALLTAAGAGVLTLLLYDLLGRLESHGSVGDSMEDRSTRGKDDQVRIASGVRAGLAACAALCVALTATWWSQGTGFEVYAFHALMMPLVTLLFLQYVDSQAAGSGVVGWTRPGAWFAFMLGLSLTNHLMTVLLAPAFLVYYFGRLGLRGAAFKRWLYLAPWFLLGLLPYLWLPIRASMAPRFNWGDPVTFDRFVAHVSGRAFTGLMFGSGETVRQQAEYLLARLPSELAYAGIAVALLGVLRILRVRLAAAVTALIVVSGAIYAVGYGIADIDPYFLTLFFGIAIWIGAGLLWVCERFGATTALGCGVALAVAGGILHYAEVDEHDNRLVEDMAINMLETAPPNALIISAQFNYWLAGSWYLQAVEGMRPDVTVLYENHLGLSWYAAGLAAHPPEPMVPVVGAINRFVEAVKPYERGEPYDPVALQRVYEEMVNAIIDANIGRRPILVTGDISPTIGERYQRVPNFLALRLLPTREYLPQEFPRYRYEPWPHQANPYVATLHELYGRSLYARGLYERGYGRDSLALEYFRYALTFDPGFDTTDLPPIPLDGHRQVIATAEFFGSLRAALGGR